jgi:hypothetical protein
MGFNGMEYPITMDVEKNIHVIYNVPNQEGKPLHKCQILNKV